MPSMSKTSIPSLYHSCLLEKAVLLMQARSSRSLDVMNVVVSRMHKDDSLVVYSHQKKCRTLISKGVRNGIPSHLQMFINRNGPEHSSWIALYGVLLIAVVSILRELHAETIYRAALVLLNNLPEKLRFIKPTISDPFFLRSPHDVKTLANYLKHTYSPEMMAFLRKSCSEMPPKVKMFKGDSEPFRKSPEMLAILDSFCPLTSPKTKLFPKYSEQFLKLPGIPANVDPFYPQKSPVKKLCANTETKLFANSEMKLLVMDLEQFYKMPKVSVSSTDMESMNFKSYRQDNRMKVHKICYLCQEKISSKKFFDERRFGILEKCDCMICYGCLRKETNTSGVVKGPVKCPSCSIKSNMVAANSCWVEGKDKLDFFELLQKNEAPQIKWGWTNFHTRRMTSALAETVLGKCDCMICHMCLQKNHTSGVKKGPVKCLYSVNSDAIAASAYLSEGEGKLGFFDLLQEHKAPKMKRGWTGLHTKKDDFCTRGQKVLVN